MSVSLLVLALALSSAVVNGASLRASRDIKANDFMLKKTQASLSKHFEMPNIQNMKTVSSNMLTSKSNKKSTFIKKLSLEESTQASTAGVNSWYVNGYFYMKVYAQPECSEDVSFQAVAYTIGACFPLDMFASDTGNYQTGRILKVSNPANHGDYLLKVAIYTDTACSVGMMKTNQRLPYGCNVDTNSAYEFSWVASLPSFPSGAIMRSFMNTADCTRSINNYATTFYPSNTCSNGDLYGEEDDVPFQLTGCSGATAGTTSGFVASVNFYGADDTTCASSVTSTDYYYSPTCAASDGIYTSLICTGSGTSGTYSLSPTMAITAYPTVSPTLAPASISHTPTMSPSALNSGYVLLSPYAPNTACTGAAEISSLALNFCYPSGSGAYMYTNFLDGTTTNSVVYTSYTDTSCTDVQVSQTITKPIGCSYNVIFSYAATLPTTGPGALITAFTSFEACTMQMSPSLMQFYPASACVGNGVLSSCSASTFTYTSYQYPDCTSEPSIDTDLVATCANYGDGLYYSKTCIGGAR